MGKSASHQSRRQWMIAHMRQAASDARNPSLSQRSDSPQTLRPEIARIIEALASAAVRREDRAMANTAVVEHRRML
jgi:hypothetical protein